MSATPIEVVDVGVEPRPYPVTIGRGLLEQLDTHVRLPDGARRALLVTQEPVLAAGHVEPVEHALRRAGIEVHRHLVADGEAAKELAVLGEVWQASARVPLSRADVVVAVGGGAVGDLGGFAAATFNRGVAVVQVPTTLLAQVDAAIGGKTGINLAEGKNLVGAFHQPVAVVCDLVTLDTLPRRTFVEGFGEVVKCGLIADGRILELIETADALDDPAMLHELVRRSVAVKAEVVATDERESGRRANLNFGHTYAHVLETLTGYGSLLHGEAVAIGMMFALALGIRMGRTPPELRDRTARLLEDVGLPTRGPSLGRSDVEEVMARDKKATTGRLRFVVLDGIGAPVVVTPDRDVIDAVLDEFDVRSD